ncbi:MAG: cytidylate kinase-like family protein [Eubacterium sp.]|nr:cytidylate kinase-like family protein [Eubacterium sp.]
MNRRNYIITVARGFGSGGKEISLKVAKKLGIPCYYTQIMKMASEISGINEREFVQTNEKLRGNALLRRLKAVPNRDKIIEPTEHNFVSDVNLFNIQAKVIRELADTESCVIIGKCANDILKDRDNVVSFYIEAPRAFCAARVMKDFGCEYDEAAKMIHHTDRYRADYYQYYTGGKKWTDPVAYDMTLNSERVTIDGCVDSIIWYTSYKLGRDILQEQS